MIEYLIVSTLLGIEIVITEKLDGENTGMKDEGVYKKSCRIHNIWLVKRSKTIT
jgi:hypothetical protein